MLVGIAWVRGEGWGKVAWKDSAGVEPIHPIYPFCNEKLEYN